MHLLLRADSTASIGAGHVMRSLALAREWVARGGAATWIGRIDSGPLAERISDAGITLLPLRDAVASQGDLTQTLEMLERRTGSGRAWVAVDGYAFTPAYHAAIRSAGGGLLIIDDLADRGPYHADIVLNQNIDADQLIYHTDDDTRLLIGARYVLLQPEFDRWRNCARETPEVARRVLVTVGGSNPHGVTEIIAAALERLSIVDLEVTIVVGPAAPGPSERSVMGRRHRYHIVRDVRDMGALMADSDLAISGGGSTCWELALLGLPAVVIELSDNQRRSAEGLARAGAADHAGAVDALDVSVLAQRIEALIVDGMRRQAMSAAGRALIDGRGRARVASRLGLGLPRIGLRRATADDSRALWQLATEPSVRAMSFDATPITWDTHTAWYAKTLAAPTTRIWVMEADSAVVGQVRYQRVESDAEIGISVSPAVRGVGLAAWLLASTWATACRELSVGRARGVVFTSNAASANAFREAGFIADGPPQVIRGHACHVFTRSLAP